MSYLPSSSPDVTEALPSDLSTRTTVLRSVFKNTTYDLEVGGLGFCLRPNTDAGPYIRQSVAVQKQQQDVSKEPGEQSLEGYWIRSQNSWHRGAGINFYEPGSEPDTEYRFTESSGVDVWTPGQVTSLNKMKLDLAAAGACHVMDAGNGNFVYLDNSSVLGWRGGVAPYAVTASPGSYNGRWYFFGHKKYIRVGWTAIGAATLGIWNGGTNTVIAEKALVEPLVWYLKDRLIVGHQHRVFEVPLNASAPVDLSAAASASYSATDPNTSYIDATEGPSAIFVGYTDGTRDGILRFTLQDASSGSTPKLSQGYRVLELPAGERLYKMFSYLGRFLILSTSAGIRVCAMDGQADLTMGQVTIPAATTGRYNSFHADSNFVYVGGADVPVSGTSGGTGLMGWTTAAGFLRINLGEPIGDGNDLRFAYARDQRTSVNGTVTSSVRLSATEQAIAVTGSGIWVTDLTQRETGYLGMGRVRHSTFVPKIFRSLDLAGSIPGGCALQVQILNEVDTSNFAVSMDPSTAVFPTLGLDLTTALRYVRPLLRLTPGGAATPSFTQVQLRSLPTPRRLRQVRYPLKCDDFESDRWGKSFGRKGYGWERLSLLEQMEEQGLPVQVTDTRTGESYTAMIDEIDYRGATAPDKALGNFGGTLNLTLTKLN